MEVGLVSPVGAQRISPRGTLAAFSSLASFGPGMPAPSDKDTAPGPSGWTLSPTPTVPPTIDNVFTVLDDNQNLVDLNQHIGLTYKTDQKLIDLLNQETKIK